MKLYGVYDKKLCKFIFTLLGENDEIAKRNMVGVLHTNGGNLSQFPHDFNVHCLAEIDMNTGDVKNVSHHLAFELINLFKVDESEVNSDGVPDSVRKEDA